jgi:hypothetical protein
VSRSVSWSAAVQQPSFCRLAVTARNGCEREVISGRSAACLDELPAND